MEPLIREILNSAPTPKRLALSLLAVPEIEAISMRQFSSWAALFAIDAATMRVAIGRLVKQGLLQSAARGVYRIGPRGESLSRTAVGWRTAEGRLKRWRGEWILVHTAHLGRSNRVALRAREQALRLEGMKPLRQELWCRPANYRETLDSTRARLRDLGLAEDALVLLAREMLGREIGDLSSLWPVAELEALYRALLAGLAESALRLPGQPLETAARESFLLGGAVIRHINADPLLPEEYIDVSLRRELIDAMLAYDTLGREIWDRFQTGAAGSTAR